MYGLKNYNFFFFFYKRSTNNSNIQIHAFILNTIYVCDPLYIIWLCLSLLCSLLIINMYIIFLNIKTIIHVFWKVVDKYDFVLKSRLSWRSCQQNLIKMCELPKYRYYGAINHIFYNVYAL